MIKKKSVNCVTYWEMSIVLSRYTLFCHTYRVEACPNHLTSLHFTTLYHYKLPNILLTLNNRNIHLLQRASTTDIFKLTRSVLIWIMRKVQSVSFANLRTRQDLLHYLKQWARSLAQTPVGQHRVLTRTQLLLMHDTLWSTADSALCSSFTLKPCAFGGPHCRLCSGVRHGTYPWF